MKIIEFDKETHWQQLRECVIELQDFERALDPRLPTGADIVDEYLPQMLVRCGSCEGQIFVAEVDDVVAGYVTIMAKVSSAELEDGDIEFGLVADLLVRPGHRGSGLGRKLLLAAEDYAIARDVKWLRIGVLAANRGAKELYSSLGFSEFFVELEKCLAK